MEVTNGTHIKDDKFIEKLKNKFGTLAEDVIQILLDEAIEHHRIDRIKHWHYIKKRMN